MYSISGLYVTMFTFPGVIVHEIAHRFFCDICGVPVLRVSYFRPANPAGYVQHAPVDSLGKALLISFGPLIVNSLLCMLLTFPFVLPAFFLHEHSFSPLLWVLAWLGFSIGMHAFPSRQDIQSVIEHLRENGASAMKVRTAEVILIPFAYICLAASVVWLDLFYAIGLSYILPSLV